MHLVKLLGKIAPKACYYGHFSVVCKVWHKFRHHLPYANT